MFFVFFLKVLIVMAGLCAWDGERLLVDIDVFCVCSCTVLYWSISRVNVLYL